MARTSWGFLEFVCFLDLDVCFLSLLREILSLSVSFLTLGPLYCECLFTCCPGGAWTSPHFSFFFFLTVVPLWCSPVASLPESWSVLLPPLMYCCFSVFFSFGSCCICSILQVLTEFIHCSLQSGEHLFACPQLDGLSPSINSFSLVLSYSFICNILLFPYFAGSSIFPATCPTCTGMVFRILVSCVNCMCLVT